MLTDQKFPLIKYSRNNTPKKWGQSHGEEFKTGIKELVEIRKELMLQKNPKLKQFLKPLALEQWEASKNFAPEITDELLGIAEGSGHDIVDIVILNNYTDFRDIELPDEGCSTIAFPSKHAIVTGQTWDMHSSAKKYVNVIHCPIDQENEALVFSLVGCVGMMGMTTKKTFVGVNNINTENARAALIWPVLVRSLLTQNSYQDIEDKLKNAPVTSGHNYLITDQQKAAHWEVTPTLSRQVSSTDMNLRDVIYHTNHCLDLDIKKTEHELAVTSTSHNRFNIIEKNKSKLNNFEDLVNMLKSHEEHPKSICSHFESGSQDPSATCGGGVFDTQSGDVKLWRGCSTYDENYIEYNFKIEGNHFCLQ